MYKGLALGLTAGLLLGSVAMATDSECPVAAPAPAKYVFLFIGDGMASPQIHAAEAYLADKSQPDELPGGIKARLLSMDHFPVVGLSTTYANDRFITDSAAAGTALACGMKTNCGVISMDPTTTIPYKTLAESAKEKGMKVGVVSSVSIDHATPAVYYSHQPSRNNYNAIAMELANSDFDYFAGGGFKRDESQGAIPAAIANGFKYVTTREGLNACVPGDRVLATTEVTDGSALPYAIDRLEGYYTNNITLAEFTARGIDLLDNPNGFFMMVEGGKIDWACHANDARAAIDDTLAFDAAIWEAIRFYMSNPEETLIVITGDHECGGMTIGFAGTSYDTAFATLAKQRKSFQMFKDAFFKDYKAASTWSSDSDNIDQTLKDLLSYFFGLNWEELTDYELAQLEEAFDRSMAGIAQVSSQEDKELYGGYEALIVTVTHILNRRAGIGFTSYSHTGVPVPVYAMGAGEGNFGGFYDNTDVAKKIATLMGVAIGEVN
ncbi:MAG: alkaline phosphatase [Deltaproteobacteria bacterium]|nr:alkaline phosphatase [Deltaproteobacteria bacterium]